MYSRILPYAPTLIIQDHLLFGIGRDWANLWPVIVCQAHGANSQLIWVETIQSGLGGLSCCLLNWQGSIVRISWVRVSIPIIDHVFFLRFRPPQNPPREGCVFPGHSFQVVLPWLHVCFGILPKAIESSCSLCTMAACIERLIEEIGDDDLSNGPDIHS